MPFDENDVFLPADQLPPPFHTGRLLMDLGLIQKPRFEQEAGVAAWLAENEPSQPLRRSLEYNGFLPAPEL